MPNTELLQQTLTHIETHPELWNQGTWRNTCGTAYCFAGWAITLAGGTFVPRVPGNTLAVPPGADPADTEQHRHVADLAAELLGIPNRGSYSSSCPGPVNDDDVCGCVDCDDMAPLFEPDNGLDDLRYIVAAHIAGEAR